MDENNVLYLFIYETYQIVRFSFKLFKWVCNIRP